jgi:hypothetical protein
VEYEIMIVPLLPVKIVLFPSSEHLICFLDHDELESIEYISYEAGPNGCGHEIIITGNDKQQVVFTDSRRVIENLTRIKRPVFIAEINVEKEIQRSGIMEITITCTARDHHYTLYFQSLFPLSNVKSGIIDPKQHGKERGLPLLCSYDNAITTNCTVARNREVIPVSSADEKPLAQFGALKAFYSADFYLGFLTYINTRLRFLEKAGESEYIYESDAGEKYSFFPEDSVCKVVQHNHPPEYKTHMYYNFIDGLVSISHYDIIINNTVHLSALFDPPVIIRSGADTTQSGTLRISINAHNTLFECLYYVTHTIKKNELISNYIIEYSNEEWEEEKRRVACETVCAVNNSGHIIEEFNVKKLEVEVITDGGD